MGQEAEERTAQNAESIAAQNAQQGAEQTPPGGSGPAETKKPMRISSPEQVDDYIRVTTPGMWLLAAAVFVLLAALVIWGFAGKVEVRTVDENGQTATEYIAPASFVTDGVTGY